MRKINICPGVYMVYVDEIDLRILCGCPMDVVKLLSRRGVIQATEKDGIEFETGPNAILLSDVATQNGQFCNLIEFPILHMQYKQGMSLPMHPNNNGQCPLVIGLPQQVQSQCAYFLRGKYGLISVKELMEAGFEEQQAIDIMRMKMCFNFGKLSKAEEQLDLFYVEGKNYSELRDGLNLRRLAHNLYEFHMSNGNNTSDETVQVDLNLFNYESYEIPYNLDYHKPTAEYFSVTHLGEGNGWDPNRASMSSLICYQGRYFLVDAPPGIDRLLNAVGISINELEGIFHTHSHDDHFAGLTSLIRSDRRLKYFATKAVRHSVTKKLAAVLSVDERMFFRMFHCFDLEFDQWNAVEGLEVMPMLSPHPVETSIFYFRTFWQNNYKYYGHLADICSKRIMKTFLTDDPTAYGMSQEHYKQVRQSYLLPVDLKKIDIGGGLIHGDAIDFNKDTSKRIVLAHLERPLDSVEKEIGSRASFALTDVLISSEIDFYMKRAEFWIKETLPVASEREISVLLDGGILHLNVDSSIIKKEEYLENIYLLLTGIVDAVNEDISITFNTGSLMGSSFVLFNKPSHLEFRSKSYVSLLQIPKEVYLQTLENHNVMEEFIATQRRIDYLQSLSLFSDSVGESVLRYISQNIDIYESEPGEQINCRDLPGLYIVFQGSIGIFENNVMQELFVAGDVLGEETILPGVTITYHYETVQKAIIYHIRAEIIQRIPVIQWKAFELHNTQNSRIHLALGQNM